MGVASGLGEFLYQYVSGDIETGQIVSRSISDLSMVQALLSMIPMLFGNAVLFVASSTRIRIDSSSFRTPNISSVSSSASTVCVRPMRAERASNGPFCG